MKRSPEERRALLNRITERIIGCAYAVSNALGCGFLEKVYENALVHELPEAGLHVSQQHPVSIQYNGVSVGEYIADILVDERVVVETKAVKALGDVHVAQCMNYLKATGLKVCLLLNFGAPKVDTRRIVNDF